MKGERTPLQVGKIRGRSTPSREPRGPENVPNGESSLPRARNAPPYYGNTRTDWGKK